MERKEAIDVIKKNWPDSSFTMLREALETLIPEIKGSEDERIRKWLIYYFKEACDNVSEKEKKGVLAWLEKQGEKNTVVVIPKFRVGDEIKTSNEESLTITKIDEKGYWSEDLFICGFDEECIWDLVGQKHVDKIEPKFKVGDWITDNNSTFQIVKVENEWYYADDGDKICFDVAHQYYHLWTIQDAKDGDVLAAHECLVLFKEIDGLNIKCYCTYHYMGLNPSFYVDTLQNKTAFQPATEEQQDQLEKAMADAGYTFDFESKELKKIEQNNAKWSKEDEGYFKSI